MPLFERASVAVELDHVRNESKRPFTSLQECKTSNVAREAILGAG